MKILNRERLAAKLAAMPQAAKDDIRKALADSAGEIVELARRIVPVDHGDLRDSIVWSYGDEKRIAHSQTLASGGEHELAVRISAGNSKVRYAHLIEFGTAPHGAHHPGTPAQPYFYPSYRLGKKRAKARIARATTRAAKKVAAGE